MMKYLLLCSACATERPSHSGRHHPARDMAVPQRNTTMFGQFRALRLGWPRNRTRNRQSCSDNMRFSDPRDYASNMHGMGNHCKFVNNWCTSLSSHFSARILDEHFWFSYSLFINYATSQCLSFGLVCFLHIVYVELLYSNLPFVSLKQ